MADVNKVKKINGKEIIADWSNIENKPDNLAKTSDIEEQIEQVRSEIPSIEGLASEEYVDDRFEELTGAAPEALDTLEELAKALGEDANFSATIIEELAKKQNQLTFDEVPTQNSTNPVTSDGLYDALFEKVDKVDGKSLSANDFTDEEKSKLEGIAENANNYTHPNTHPGSMIDGFKYIYIQSEEPVDAEDGSLWIDTNEELGTLPIAEEASF